MNNPIPHYGGPAAELSRAPDDFDFLQWLKNQTLPMELAPARLLRLRNWLEGQGFRAVKIVYRAQLNKFRLVMNRGVAQGCSTDEEVDNLLKRAAQECGAEAEAVIGLAMHDDQILGSLSLRQSQDRTEPPEGFEMNLPGERKP